MEQKKSHLFTILYVLMAICAAGVIISACIYYSDSREYAKGDSAYKEVHLLLETSSPSEEQNGLKSGDGETAPVNSQGKQSIKYNFAPLKKINPDVVGWIYSDGTEIDYPIMRGSDNDYYLRRLFTGEKNKLGSIFMDYRSGEEFLDKNTVIYGHNMKDGSMFSSLTKYADQSYFKNHPSMILYTPSGDYTVELFAGIVTDSGYGLVRFDFNGDADFLSYINTLNEKSTFRSDIAINSDDRIITFCTCSYEYKNTRYALYGKLTPVYD